MLGVNDCVQRNRSKKLLRTQNVCGLTISNENEAEAKNPTKLHWDVC